jgi:hypothetical protein
MFSLRAEGFSCSLDVPYGGLGIIKLQFLIKKKIKKISAVFFFFNFWPSKTSVSDPYSFFPDPDPEVEPGDQYGSGSGSNPDPGLNDQKLKKNNS